MKLDLITNKAEKQSGFIYGNTNQKEIIGNINPNDEYYTPNYAIEPILKYLKPNSIVWCPFDTVNSNFVKIYIYVNSRTNQELPIFHRP